MKLKRGYWKLIKDEIESPLTTGVEITRGIDEDSVVMTIIVKSQALVEHYGTPEMRKDFIPFYTPMDIAPGEYNRDKEIS